MPKISYYLRGRNERKQIYCRFSNGRGYNLRTPLDIHVYEDDWDKRSQLLKDLIRIKNSGKINKKLLLFKVEIHDAYTLDNMQGEIIDNAWLKEQVRKFFERPEIRKDKNEMNRLIYFTDFADWWVDKGIKTHVTKKGTYTTPKKVKAYKAVADYIKEFESFEYGKKITFKNLTHKVLTDFIKYMQDDMYAVGTMKKKLRDVRYFIHRAEDQKIKVNDSYKQFTPIDPAPIIKKPYLNRDEIRKLYEYNFDDNERLDSARDNFIIACWTAFRISDFNHKLSKDKIINTYNKKGEITSSRIRLITKKTKREVSIPLHWMIKEILKKRKGGFPKTTSDAKFNLAIKDVCKAVGFTQKMEGAVAKSKILPNGKRKTRDIPGTYEKWELISSHIGRVSFATNHLGLLKNSTIMHFGAWKSEKVMLGYINATDEDYIKEIEGLWGKQEKEDKLRILYSKNDKSWKKTS